MIHEIAPYQFDNQYAEASPDAGSFVIFVQGSTVLIHDDGQNIACPLQKSIQAYKLPMTYLFTVSGKRFFLVLLDSHFEKMPLASASNPDEPATSLSALSSQETEGHNGMLAGSEAAVLIDSEQSRQFDVQDALALLKQEGYEFYDAPLLRQRSPQWLCYACATALQLGRWYEDNRFCGRCASPLHKSAEERALICKHCGKVVYPKICPAVIVGLIDGDKILLTQYAGSKPSKHFALIAGFTEVGETLEETVQREVMEEVGVRVKNIRYYKDQPWPFSDTLLAGFFCDLDGSPEISMDSHELSVAKWVKRSDIDTEYDGISLTNEMMVLFKENRIPSK